VGREAETARLEPSRSLLRAFLTVLKGKRMNGNVEEL